MSILLVTPTPMEMEAVLAGIMPRIEAQSLAASLAADSLATRHNTTPITVNGRNIFLLTCGVGPLSAALHLGLALGNLHKGPIPLRGVLNMGIAGSYDAARIPLGSVVQASCEIFPEFGLWTEQGIAAEGLGFAQAEVPKGAVFDRLPPGEFECTLETDCEDKAKGPDGKNPRQTPEKTAPASLCLQKGLGNMGLNCHSFPLYGPSVTVAGVSGTPDRAAELARRTGGAIENMEGFSLALGAARCDLAFAEVRTVSNLVGYRPPHNWNIRAALDALTDSAEKIFRA